MFNKALFKQSSKANGVMWSVITFAVCFMLACVMLISGGGNIGEVKNSIQDTIIVKEVDAQLQKRALSYYSDANSSLEEFDESFSAASSDVLAFLTWSGRKPDRADYADDQTYVAATAAWAALEPQATTRVGEDFADGVTSGSIEPTVENGVKAAYSYAVEKVRVFAEQTAIDRGFASDSLEAQEIFGSAAAALNPDGALDYIYVDNGDEVPEDYDVLSLIAKIGEGSIEEYLCGAERGDYRQTRARTGASAFLAANMAKSENVESLITALSSYGVTREKYQSFGYTYSSVKSLSATAISTLRGRFDYELGVLGEKFEGGEFASREEYDAAVKLKEAELSSDIASSFLSTLPSTVSDALEEVGKADLYALIVGSIFYKLAGLLLPIIFMIMASNNLIAGQVDSGSMAYVLSTSVKRTTVAFTQAVYLVGSLFATFLLTTATGCVCLAIVGEGVGLTYGELILLNVGAFLVLFALSGLCFLTSCYFDRSKRSMAVGGGLSIFALVAAMLGLFGSLVIPSVVRLDALNYFNYATIISLFDVVSIIDGGRAFIWKFVILAALGVIGYVLGAIKFDKKDLPL